MAELAPLPPPLERGHERRVANPVERGDTQEHQPDRSRGHGVDISQQRIAHRPGSHFSMRQGRTAKPWLLPSRSESLPSFYDLVVMHSVTGASLQVGGGAPTRVPFTPH